MTEFEFTSELDCRPDDLLELDAGAAVHVRDIARSRVTLEVNDRNGHYIVVFQIPPDFQIPPNLTLFREEEPVMQTDLLSQSAACSEPDSQYDEEVEAEESWTLEYLLLGDLVELLQEPYDEENRRWLLVVLDGLLDAIPAEGRLDRLRWFQSFFRHSESLQTALIRMELEYEELIFQLRKLRNRVAWRLSLLEVLAAEVCCDLKVWLQNFQQFSAREAEFRRTAEQSLNEAD